ncbi:MAG: hypothetical protein V3T28_06155 [Gemmatimonadales bacterium]
MPMKPYTLAAARDVMSQDEADGYGEWNIPDFIGERYALTEQARALAYLTNSVRQDVRDDPRVVNGVSEALVDLADALNELFEGAERIDKHIRADTIIEYDAALRAAQ